MTTRLDEAMVMLDEVAREMHHWRVFMAGAYRCHPSCLRCRIDKHLHDQGVPDAGATGATEAGEVVEAACALMDTQGRDDDEWEALRAAVRKYRASEGR